MRRPSFFLIGNSKSGTTALYHFLKAHPQLFLCCPKEPNYFARDFCRDTNPEGAFFQRSEDSYHALFQDALPNQKCGESSACYLYSKVAAEGIKAYEPDARLIVMLREPVSFLYSYYWQLRKNPITEGEELRRFADALALEEDRKAGRRVPRKIVVPELLYYSDRIRYAEQLDRVYQSFDRSQVKVIIYDDFLLDNAGGFRDVLSFLGVDASFEPTFKKYNRGSATRSRTMKRFVRNLTFGNGWAAPIKAVAQRVVPTNVRRAITDRAVNGIVHASIPPIDPGLAADLRVQFRAEVKKLGDLLGQDLTKRWGYDSRRRSGPV